MKTYEFTIIATGLDPEADDFADRFFEAACDDGTVSFQKGAIVVEFVREAKSFGHALISAIEDVMAAGVTVIHVEPDHLVSLSDIALRAGITRAAASNYSTGNRGEGFPPPVARVTTSNPLWDWVDVARWFHASGRLQKSEILRARLIRRTNQKIAQRNGEHVDRANGNRSPFAA